MGHVSDLNAINVFQFIIILCLRPNQQTRQKMNDNCPQKQVNSGSILWYTVLSFPTNTLTLLPRAYVTVPSP